MAKNIALKRIQKDIDRVMKQEDSGFIINYEEDNLFEASALILGPQGTIWEGGIFDLSIVFDENYPNSCPKVVFKSKMYHPNIYHDGRICLDIITTQWSPSYDVMAILVSIRSLLNSPNPLSPANNEACQVYLKQVYEYERRVKEVVAMSQQEQEQ